MLFWINTKKVLGNKPRELKTETAIPNHTWVEMLHTETAGNLKQEILRNRIPMEGMQT